MFEPIIRLISGKLKNEVDEIYANRIIRTFAISLISVFIPIFLLKHNFSLRLAILYIFYMFFFLLVFSFVVVRLQKRIGLKHCLFISIFFLAIYLSLILFLSDVISGFSPIMKSIYVFLLGLTLGLNLAFYWMPINILFSSDVKDHIGINVGLLAALPSLTAGIAPLIGGLIITHNVNVLMIITLVLLIISIMPLFFTKEKKYAKMVNINKSMIKNNKGLILGYIIQGAVTSMMWLWAIIVFRLIGTYMSVAYISTLESLSIALVSIGIGLAIEKYNKTRLFRIGVVFNSVVYILVFFVVNSKNVYLLSILMGSIIGMYVLPLFAATCRMAEHNPGFMIFREIWLSVGRLPLLLLALIIPLNYSLLIAAAVLLIGGLANIGK